MHKIRYDSPQMTPKQHRRRGQLIALLIFLVALYTLPRYWCGRQAAALWSDRPAAIEPLARGVSAWVGGGVHDSDFHTGSALFNAEWTFGSYFMAGMGLTQLVLRMPATHGRYLPIIDKCVDKLLHNSTRMFDTNAWKEDAMRSLKGDKGHAAYLGDLNLLLGLYRQVNRDNARFNNHNRRISRALARRLEESDIGLIETYPGQVYPVDNAAVIGSLALFDRAEGSARHRKLLARWGEHTRHRYVHKDSGLLYQAVDASTGEPRDKPRASGTALAAYFLSFSHPALSAQLFAALKESVGTSFLGFGLVREYPSSVKGGKGDIDSGPVVFGLSFSGTGFAIAAARIHGDRGLFADLYSTAYLMGAPFQEEGRRNFVAGGPLGNAILLAMITAGPGGYTK